jgi:hypothetical protein
METDGDKWLSCEVQSAAIFPMMLDEKYGIYLTFEVMIQLILCRSIAGPNPHQLLGKLEEWRRFAAKEPGMKDTCGSDQLYENKMEMATYGMSVESS